jgi:hypothetical protein
MPSRHRADRSCSLAVARVLEPVSDCYRAYSLLPPQNACECNNLPVNGQLPERELRRCFAAYCPSASREYDIGG